MKYNQQHFLHKKTKQFLHNKLKHGWVNLVFSYQLGDIGKFYFFMIFFFFFQEAVSYQSRSQNSKP